MEPPAGDIRLVWDPVNARADVRMLISGSFLDTGHELESAVLISLFTDQMADPGDVLPADLSTDPRGWWADTYSGDLIGSKLWQVMGRVRNQDTLNFAGDAVRKALAWMIEDVVASAVNVVASFYGSGGLRLDIAITSPTGTTNRFAYAWSDMTERMGGAFSHLDFGGDFV
jgi:phage gp46-like protein